MYIYMYVYIYIDIIYGGVPVKLRYRIYAT